MTNNAGRELIACRECGMPVASGEYHPYAACLMFRGCLDSQVVRANLSSVTRAQASGVPVINIRCETVSDGIKGSTYLNVIGVEQEDDSSFTVVTDHWPKSSGVPVERLEALMRPWRLGEKIPDIYFGLAKLIAEYKP